MYIRNIGFIDNFDWRLDSKKTLNIHHIFSLIWYLNLITHCEIAVIDFIWLLDSFNCCSNMDDFLIFYYLYSIYLYCTYLCVTFRHWRRALHGTRVSHGRSNICSSVIAPLLLSPYLFLSLPVTLMLSDESVSLYCLWTTRGYRYTHEMCVCRAWNYLSRGPTSFCGFYGCTLDGISFSFASASKVYTASAIQATVKTAPSVATRIAPRSFAPDKALPSLPSCLSSLLAVACCRFMSLFCECTNSTRRLPSLSYNSHPPFDSGRFASRIRATVPAG